LRVVDLRGSRPLRGSRSSTARRYVARRARRSHGRSEVTRRSIGASPTSPVPAARSDRARCTLCSRPCSACRTRQSRPERSPVLGAPGADPSDGPCLRSAWAAATSPRASPDTHFGSRCRGSPPCRTARSSRASTTLQRVRLRVSVAPARRCERDPPSRRTTSRNESRRETRDPSSRRSPTSGTGVGVALQRSGSR
jgi:hypothetical protein